MLIAGVVCLAAALACVGFGLRTLTRPVTGDSAVVLRALAPAQLVAALLLAAGGAVAFAGPPAGVVVLVVCVVGAAGTLAAASWQGARYLARRDTGGSAAGCAGSCAGCTLPCS